MPEQMKIFKTTGFHEMTSQIWNAKHNSLPTLYTLIYRKLFTAPNII